eukprot:7838341-Karenia_brevis.AAC.1
MAGNASSAYNSTHLEQAGGAAVCDRISAHGKEKATKEEEDNVTITTIQTSAMVARVEAKHPMEKVQAVIHSLCDEEE